VAVTEVTGIPTLRTKKFIYLLMLYGEEETPRVAVAAGQLTVTSPVP